MLLARFLLAVALDLASGSVDKRPLVVSRHYHGDLFTFKEQTDECAASFCYDWGGLGAAALEDAPCRCRCEPPYPTYREDIGACVNDIQECHLADFSQGATQEKVPFVFMPERGQLVHPAAEITMSDLSPDAAPVVSPVCVVSGAEVVSRSGWVAVNSTFEPPFRLNRDQGKTYLQWMGDGVSPEAIAGRVVLVRLLCKDAGNQLRPRFSPCVAFRVAGTQGQAEAISQAEEGGAGSLAVGLGIGAVLLLYLLAMAGYLVHRRRRRRAGHRLIEDALIGKPAAGRDTTATAAHRQSRRGRSDSADAAEEPTDLTQRPGSSLSLGSAGSGEVNERLPEDPLATLVDGGRDSGALDDDDDAGSQNSPLRRRLYFNPAFFDPDLLHDPPPGALEFLSKIREMITIAKIKMQAKQYVPSLPPIAEASNEEAAGEQCGAPPSTPRHTSVDIDRWLETVVRESASDSEPPYSDRSLSAGKPAAPVAAPTVGVTSWRQQARQQQQQQRPQQQQQQQQETDDSDTLVGESGDEWQRAAGAGDESLDSDDTLNDLVSEAESKVPKLHSDEDSEAYSELATVARGRRRPGPGRRAGAAEDGVYEEIQLSSDKSLSAFSGEYTSVSINGDGSVIRTGGKMTIEVEAAAASDAESEEEVFDPDTLEKRRIRVRKARKVRRKPSFYDDSLERRKRGVNYEEKFETTHINVLNTSAESGESVYRRWGSGSDNNSVYSRINFVTGKPAQRPGLVVGNLRHSQRNLKTFKDYGAVKFEGQTSLLDQWKKKTEPQSLGDPEAGSLPPPTPSPAPASPVVPSPSPHPIGQPQAEAVSPTARSQPTPPIPPKVAAAAPVPDIASAPPLPPRTHSPQRERALRSPPAAVSPSAPPRPARAAAQPPLPPKTAPPLPSKTRPAPPPPPPPPPVSPPAGPTGRRYFLGQIDGTAEPGSPRRRQNSAGESETNSTGSSTSAEECSSSGSGRGSRTLGRQVEARLERHLQRSYSASDVSRSEGDSLASSRSSLRSAQPRAPPPNVLERITACESAIRRGAGAGTGMAIALSLRQRQRQHTDAASVRHKLRRLVEPPPPPTTTTAAATTGVRDDSGYQSTDSADSHRRPAAALMPAAALNPTGAGDGPAVPPPGIRRLVRQFDRAEEAAAEPASPTRTRWVHVK